MICIRVLEHYQKGINLGGWISQPLEYTQKHFNTFITEADIKEIAEMGFDHIRLPVDYDVIQNEDKSFNEIGLRHIDDCIQWASKYSLHMILDLHKTAGYSFDAQEASSSFFKEAVYQEQFIDIWRFLATRYGKYDDMLAFEILNEIVDPNAVDAWNRLSRRCILAIRKIAPSIKILLGGIESNSVKAIKYLDPPIDSNIVFNFHCYEPMVFTHQNAYWVKGMPSGLKISYPKPLEELQKETCKIKAFCPSPILESKHVGKAFFEDLFHDAIQVAEAYDVPLYCGEFGVIKQADPNDALVWFTDITVVLKKYGIGYAMWNYKNKDFGLVDDFIDVKDTLIGKII